MTNYKTKPGHLIIAMAMGGSSLLFCVNAFAIPFDLVFENRPEIGNEVYALSYNSLPDFINANAASSSLTLNNFQTGGDIAGFTYDGSQYHVVFENRPEIGNEVYALSYNSLPDFINANAASSSLTLNNFQTGGDIAGFTYDGSQYHVVFENRPEIGNEVYVLSYNSLPDFINANAASSSLTLNNFQTGGDIAGFTYDGSQYHVVFENRPEIGNEVYVLSYNSLPDFINANAASSSLTLNNFQTGGDIAGFEAIRSMSGPAPVPEPATMLLFGTGLVGLVGSRLRRKK